MDALDPDNVIRYEADGTSNKVYPVKEGEGFRFNPQSVKLNSWLYQVILLGRPFWLGRRCNGERKTRETRIPIVYDDEKEEEGKVRGACASPAGMLFLIAGRAKLLSVFGGAIILKWLDPALRLPGWLLMSPAGVVEVGVGLLCALAKGCLCPRAVVAVVVGWFDFGSGDGLAFRGKRPVSGFGRVVGGGCEGY